jgi:DNA integrity scanning protein DisA with diadenylate cyclase activity
MSNCHQKLKEKGDLRKTIEVETSNAKFVIKNICHILPGTLISKSNTISILYHYKQTINQMTMSLQTIAVSQFFRLLKRIQIMFSLRKRETRAPRATL